MLFRYQLVGVTALFTASKIEEMYPPEIRDFVYITDNSYTAADIRQTELRLYIKSILNINLSMAILFDHYFKYLYLLLIITKNIHINIFIFLGC